MVIKITIKAEWLLAVFLMAYAGYALSGNTLDVEPEVCEEPRPQMCTMDYRPVCGTTLSGEEKTYSNGCSACSETSVLSYVPGECPE